MFFDGAIKFFQTIGDMFEWFGKLDDHIIDFTMKLLGWVYQFLSDFILQMPVFLFSTNWFYTLSLIFCVISVFLTIILSITEGIKAIIDKPYTDISRIIKRFPIALVGAGFAPIAFEKVLGYLNTASTQIIEAGRSIIATNLYGTGKLTLSLIDAFALLAFDIAIIAMLFPLFMNMARRWFDILALGTLTPLATICWVFKDHEGYFHKWWDSIKKLSMMQLYYATFTTIIGILILGVHNSETFGSLIVKIGIVIGGLWRMINPPQEFKKHVDTSGDIKDIVKQTKDKLSLGKERKQMEEVINNIKGFGDKKSNRRKNRVALVKRGRMVQKIKNIFKK